MQKRSAFAVIGAVLLAGCAHEPKNYPVTQFGKPLTELDATRLGNAPEVARGVDAARIARARTAEPHNWLTYYGAYDGQRYSSLDQITAGNVGSLRPAWVFQAGVIGLIATPATYAFEAAPIVVDGVMYVSGWDGYVWALDAVSGRMYWRYRHAIPLDVPLCCGNVNRGVAVAHGKVFFTTPNGHLIALDAVTGKRLWSKVWLDVRAGESSTLAPLVVKDMVIVGSSGAEYGVRGHIDAFDMESGARRWRRYNVPKPGEPGSDTWGGDSWQRGGGAAWITGTYDPDLDTLYWSTANPSPDFDGDVRPGDNLYTNAVLALDPDDGSLKWHFQFTPHDVWDYDGVNENILFDQDGRKLLAHFDKNGYLYVLDRTNGQPVRVLPFFPRAMNWGEVDQTGKVVPRVVPSARGEVICPGPAGAKEWPHAAYNRQTRLLYAPVVDVCGTFKKIPSEFKEGMAYWGGDALVLPEHVKGGQVRAFDPGTGRLVWEWKGEHPMVGSLLTTAGGLVFGGEPTGLFNAWDARTGELLWQFNTGSGIHSSPVTYAVKGRQYVAVPSGWGGWMKGFAPEAYGATRGSALFVFALP